MPNEALERDAAKRHGASQLGTLGFGQLQRLWFLLGSLQPAEAPQGCSAE